VLNGIHGNLTNNAKIHRPNGIEQAIELLNDLQLNNHRPYATTKAGKTPILKT
jgi:transposase